MEGEPLGDDVERQLRQRVLREQLAALVAKGSRERHELVTTGFDDFLQLLGPPKAPNATPTSVGIKIPTLPSSTNSGKPYLALCAVCDLDKGERFVGFAQYLTIATILGSEPSAPDGPAPAAPAPPIPPFRYRERDVVTPGWRFEDVPPPAWFVTVESLGPKRLDGPLDQASFSLEDSGTPAMVYSVGTTFPAVPTVPGYLGLNFYVPPQMLGTSWYACRDMHYPMRQSEFCAMRFVARGSMRVRVYAQVTQTDPTVRTDVFPFANEDMAAAALCPEDAWLEAFPNTAQYRSVGCRLIVDKFTSRRVPA